MPVVARAAALLVLASSACQPQPRVDRYDILVSTTSDHGDPVAGVVVSVNGKELGTTGTGGAIALSLDAPAGKELRIQTQCPTKYRSPSQEVPLRLRRTESIDSTQGGALHVATKCLPRKRKTAVVVRTPGFSDLPVMVRGREIARTDEFGTAHLLFELIPGSEFKLTVDTTTNPYVHPSNPTETIAVGDADDVIVFNPELVERRPKKKRRRKKKKHAIVKVKTLHGKPWDRR